MNLLVGTSTKMNLTSTDARVWCESVRASSRDLTGLQLFILPPFPAIWAAREELAGSEITWGAQDVHPEDAGAHTGDVSAPMLADLGCAYVECGHSERRRDHGEDDGLIALKVAAILRWEMTPILCVGEPSPGAAVAAGEFVAAQAVADLVHVAPDHLDRVVIAYEPAWAIGAGSVAAAPEHIATVHAIIRQALLGIGPAGGSARVIYGGSVSADAVAGILSQPGVDGLFVGRAALDPAQFLQIARIASGVAATRVAAA